MFVNKTISFSSGKISQDLPEDRMRCYVLATAEQKQVHRLVVSYFYCGPRVWQARQKGRTFLGAVRERETACVNHPDSRDINCA